MYVCVRAYIIIIYYMPLKNSMCIDYYKYLMLTNLILKRCIILISNVECNYIFIIEF